MRAKKKILLMAASPRDKTRLRLDEEMREIEAGLRRSSKRDRFDLEQRLAVRPADLRHAMLDLEPQIVHFCGYGSGSAGLVLEDESGNSRLVTSTALASLFALFAGSVECVILNSCYSEDQAQAISQHVRYVIGMRQEIRDDAAIKFAVGFYDALGAGQSIERAFEFGKSAIELELAGLSDYLIPVLLTRQDAAVDPATATGVQQEADTVYSALGQLSPAKVNAVLRRYKDALVDDGDDADAHYNLGLVYLQLKLYDLAQRHFQKAFELSPDAADAHYYYALSLLRGRRPQMLTLQEVRAIEGHLSAAIQLDDRPSKYYYLLAILRYDYYRANGLAVPPPNDDELLQAADLRELDAWEVERMLSAVIVREPQLLARIRRREARDPGSNQQGQV